jgi:hypothetical protein
MSPPMLESRLRIVNRAPPQEWFALEAARILALVGKQENKSE